MANVLIIDDDQVICDILAKMMDNIGHDTQSVLTGSGGLEMAQNGFFDIVFLDVNLPDVNGLDLIKDIKQVPSLPEIIIITGESDPDGAEMAIKSGAWNYLEKPFLRQELNLQVSRALLFRKEKGEISTTGTLKRNAIVGDSKPMQHCLEQIATSAYSGSSVLISGQPGTGKKLFAKTIHLNSDRSKNNFVMLDCAAMDETGFESILFGSKKGTGTPGGKAGLLGQADSGTLFLDEVFSLPLKIQQSLLFAIEQQRVQSTGKGHVKVCNFRVIASTSYSRHALEDLSREGKIVSDLFDILKSVHIKAPSLQSIQGDVVKIALSYIDQYCKKYNVAPKGVSPEFIDIIATYKWPGNVTEMISAIDKAVASAKNEPTLYSIHLPSYVKSVVIKNIVQNSRCDSPIEQEKFLAGDFPPLKVFIETSEKQYLTTILSHAEGDVKEACQISGVSMSRMYDRLRKYGLT